MKNNILRISLLLNFLIISVGLKAEVSFGQNLLASVKQILADPQPKDFVYLAPGAFVLGMASSLTPCIYPMIPVTANIFGAAGQSSLLSTLWGAFSYFLGVVTVYSGAGFLAARTGTFFGRWFSSPYFLVLAMLFFLLMSLYSLGLVRLDWLNNFGLSRLVGPTGPEGGMSAFRKYLLGAAVGLTASPCITPALAMLISFAGKTSMPALGFLLLFSYSLGFCFLLLLSGVLFSKAILARPGKWMNYFKNALALLVAFYGFSFIYPLVGPQVFYLLCAVYSVVGLSLARAV